MFLLLYWVSVVACSKLQEKKHPWKCEQLKISGENEEGLGRDVPLLRSWSKKKKS